MAIAVEKVLPWWQRLSYAARYYYLRVQYRQQQRRVDFLSTALELLKEQHNDLKACYNEVLGDRDVLQGIGVERQEDGSWVFNFYALLKRMNDDDLVEVRDALEKQGKS